MEVLRDPPSRSDFTSLSEHQSQTPASFYDGPAILYYHCSPSTLKISKRDLGATTAFAGLASGAKRVANGQVNGHSEEPLPNGENSHEEEEAVDPEVEIDNVDIWVTSERFLLYSPAQHSGVSIPYPSISLHAIQRPSPPTLASPPTTTTTRQSASLFLQILPEASATFDDHDPDETISLYITPSSSSTSTATTTSAPDTTSSSSAISNDSNSNDNNTITTALFAALSTCANLHPDPLVSDDDDDDGDFPIDDNDGIIPLNDTTSNNSEQQAALPPPMPGSGGWITAENVGEFVDAEGNFNWRGRGGESGSGSGARLGLGEGAGRVRGRGDGDDGDEGGEGVDGEETKWSRTG